MYYVDMGYVDVFTSTGHAKYTHMVDIHMATICTWIILNIVLNNESIKLAAKTAFF